ncbi:hypothetical protein CBR_g26327 [Chara braunii]|uniref:Signal peptide peptidase-like 3 n=1 Tax=Chara braunii TaxID=69332 RepID=A0A388L7N1_CHABU|nr:hypothetical protein CBR_g26327 [Chara braunii]|eukprot:GBG78297.1 hypothetical protein CBR_g26327 [Chara braunii]
MSNLSNLLYLLEPASLALMSTAMFVVLASAQRALTFEKESERHREKSESHITLDSSQALMIPIASSCSLLVMFYLFTSVSQLVMAFTAVASASSLAFCLAPYVTQFVTQVGATDSTVARCPCGGGVTKSQVLLIGLSSFVVLCWLVSGHWVLNNLLGIAICIAFVSHVRLPNIKICALLLACLFVYDVFWVFFSESFFGANVMVSVATQQASNPVHTVAHTLNLPLPNTITKKLDLPVKLVFPRAFLGGSVLGSPGAEFMMLGLGDMAIPGMLLALVLCFDYRKIREYSEMDLPSRRYTYIWYAAIGYGVGLVLALAAGVLTRSPQPALLYLVPSTLGPVAFGAWMRRELDELWNGSKPYAIIMGA